MPDSISKTEVLASTELQVWVFFLHQLTDACNDAAESVFEEIGKC